MSLDGVKALTFDVFGTVVDWRSSIAREAEAFLGPRGYALDWTAFADAWRDRYQPAMEQVRSGAREWTNLDQLHYENLEGVLESFGVEGLTDDDLDYLNKAWHRLDPWPDSVSGITRLKSKFIVATQSNGNIALMVNMAKRAGLPWDMVLGAEVCRAYKPMPESYQRAAAYLGLRPEECMMTAAHSNDLEAAAACGFRTAFVHRPDEKGPEKRAEQAPTREFDVMAEDFNELADKLGC